MPRPQADVVVPFLGELGDLRRLADRLGALRLRDGDTVLIVDNTPRQHRAASQGPVDVMAAPELQTPAYARNRGVERGRAEWLVFLDADVVAPDDLLDSYFSPLPAEGTALLAGGIRDEPAPGRRPGPASRWMAASAQMSQDQSLRHGRWGFPQTANAACRRAAFEQVGGFRAEARAAEDADLWYRLRDAGWEMERREHAMVVHHTRPSVRALMRQQAQHGAGAAWLDRHYPGSFPARRLPGLAWWALRWAAKGVARGARHRDREEAVRAVLDASTMLAWELGRSRSNERRRA